MTREKRLNLIKEVKDYVGKSQSNIATLYFLVATMTDKELLQFHKKITNNETTR